MRPQGGGILGHGPHPVALRQPGGDPGPRGSTLRHLGGDGLPAQVLEIRETQAIAEPVPCTLGVERIGQRLRQEPCGVGREQNQHASVPTGVGLCRFPDSSVPVVLGRVGDHRRTGDVLAGAIRMLEMVSRVSHVLSSCRLHPS